MKTETEDLSELPIKFGDWDEVVFNPDSEAEDYFKVLVVDVETTGISQVDDEVIELGGVLLKVNRETGLVYSVTPLFNWLRDPKTARISAKITQLTGITPEMVIGKDVDAEAFLRFVEEADLIVAHNAWFDRPMVEKTVPGVVALNKPWACTCWDAPWKQELGYKKKKLEVLVNSNGYKFPAHRAINDTIAVGCLLVWEPTALDAIIKKGTEVGYSLEYISPPKESKSHMKALGFGYRSGKMYKYYASFNDMRAERAQLSAYFDKHFNGAHQCYPRKEDPQTRFRREA